MERQTTGIKESCQKTILGNIITHNYGNGQKLMLIAHADAVKMMVTYIDERGFLYLKPYGSIDVNILPSRQLIIHHGDKEIIGIVGKKPIHLQRDETNTKLSWEDIWVDIGAQNKEDALTMVEIGDYAYFQLSRAELSNSLISGSSLDNSCGIQILHCVLEQINNGTSNYDIYFVESNFEEIGMRGAIEAANLIHPNICIAVDVTHATDYPSMNPIKDGDIKVGDGCVLALGSTIDNGIFNELKDIAESNKIPYQIEPCPFPTGTDANVVQISNTGVRTAVVSIPCRYMHTPHEVASLIDIQSATKLLVDFIKK